MRSSIVIPMHNEEGNIVSLLDGLIALREKTDYEIIIVDDNSSDLTGPIANMYAKANGFIRVIHRKKGDNGMGYALKEGTRAAEGENIIWLMGDRSDDLNTIPRIIERLDEYSASGRGAMVVASRYIPKGSSGDMGQTKAVLSWGYTAVARAIFGMRVHDITNAFRGFHRRVFDGAEPESGDFAISPEFAIRAHMRGYVLDEVPTRYFDRQAGKTNFNFIKMGWRYVSLFRLRLGS